MIVLADYNFNHEDNSFTEGNKTIPTAWNKEYIFA